MRHHFDYTPWWRSLPAADHRTAAPTDPDKVATDADAVADKAAAKLPTDPLSSQRTLHDTSPLDIPKNHEHTQQFPQPITTQLLTTIQTITLTPRRNGFFPFPNCPRYPDPDQRKIPKNTITHYQNCTSAAKTPLFRTGHGF